MPQKAFCGISLIMPQRACNLLSMKDCRPYMIVELPETSPLLRFRVSGQIPATNL